MSDKLKKGLYRMSNTEIEEAKEQVKRLIEIAFLTWRKVLWASFALFSLSKVYKFM